MMLNVMKTLCGSGFRPAEAQFAHSMPRDVRPFRRFVRAPLRFDAEHYALVFASRWLGFRLPDPDIELQRLLHKQITSLELGQIAISLGYTRERAFARAFRRWSGTDPAVWRMKGSRG